MTRIELQSSGVIDLYDDIPINQTFSIYDLEDPNVRTGSWSKTITLPGTANNNDLFKHIYEVDSYCNFNPLIKAKVLVYDDYTLFMQGYMLLNNIIINDDKIEYEVNIFTSNSGFFFDMGDGLMQDVDISQYNLELTSANIEASWTGTIGEGVVFPMIDYGFYLGNGWGVQHFRPAVYVKTYIDALFSLHGYTYTSPFFESEFFKRLIIPFSGGEFKLKENEVQDIRVRSYVTSNQVFYINSAGAYITNYYTNVVQFPNETLDGKGQFNPSTGIFKATEDRYLIITVDNMTYNVANDAAQLQICIRTAYGGFTVMKELVISGSGNTGTISSPWDVKVGDEIFVRIRTTKAEPVTISTGTFATDPLNASISTGDLVDLNTFIPKKIKQKDFFMSIVKMFNLLINVDKNNTTNLIIESRNDFYSSGVVVDWSDKVDYNKPKTISLLLNKLKAKYNYTYKMDKDWFNTRYQDRYGEAYGTKSWELGNNISTGEESVSVIFSPTPLLQHNGLYYPDISDTGKSTVSEQPTEYNIRILYYGGLQLGGWKYNNNPKLEYPYCGHLDRPINPEKDLSWGVPKEVYYNPTTYTTANLFNVYYKQHILDISDKDARLVTMYINLDVVDISILDFRNIFYADGHYLRLLEVVDYQPNGKDTTKCVFIKLKTKDIAHSDNYTYNYPEIDGSVLTPM